ncbi:MAG: exosortase system-associated protein, TIGR04073 family [Candidatus Omnitrophica bacterium]|nr:exosortase system-associated protein, TIGR04073 family [Candidatus Omnitrophota bacterium]
MRRSRSWVILCLGLAAWLIPPAAAVAEEAPRTTCPICARANEASPAYPAKAASTLGRGVANALFGWTELIRQPAQEAKAGGNVLVGIGKGVGQGVGRTLAGIGEALTFWTPKVQDRYLRFATDCPICMGQHADGKPRASEGKR